jgi:S-adenosylhomocysteine hydrolase
MELPATTKLLKSWPELISGLKDKDVLIVQHLLTDTLAFIRTLIAAQVSVRAVIGIPYSAKREVVHELENLGIDTLVPDLEKIPDVVLRHIHDSQKAGRQSIIHEVGGYCAPLAHQNREFGENCQGVVEETKQGLWRYASVGQLLVPVVQFADAQLKKCESEFVGRAVVRSVDEDLACLGKSIETIDIAVIGFGDIGSGVARSLRRRGCHVWCYDIKTVRMMDAVSQGFRCAEPGRLFTTCHAIIGATGVGCMAAEQLESVRDRVLFASASSRDLEFPIAAIRQSKAQPLILSPHVKEYQLKSGKRIRVSSDGFPVNFRAFSLPPSFGDLMFCQVVAGFHGLLGGAYSTGLHPLAESDQELIARIWWESYADHDPVSGCWEVSA